MKTLILSAAVLLTITFNSFAATTDPLINDKAQQTFNETFKNAYDVSWTATGNNYEAFFTVDGIKTRALIDNKGTLVQTIRYYNADKLSSFVLASLQSNYKGMEIFGITEVTNENGVNYRIILMDNKYYTHINANSAGETQMVKRYKRGDK